MTETHHISQPPAVTGVREEGRAAWLAAEAAVTAGQKASARTRQRLIDLREQSRAICTSTRAAVAASKEVIARPRRAT